MTDQEKQPPVKVKIPFARQLLIAAIVVIIAAIVILIVGKVLFGGLLALFGAVLGVGSQVSRDTKL